jgi:conjugative relaxase-like TrwC/TraI family protein
MAWVTVLGPDMAQVEYRLSEQCGCDLEHEQGQQVQLDGEGKRRKKTPAPAPEEDDAQVDYRLGDARDLEWIGGGLAEVGLVAGEAVDKDAARALMDGRDPRTGERLVVPKVAVDPRAKLQARPLAEAIEKAAAEHGLDVDELLGDAKLIKRFARMQRGIHREGDRHRIPVRAVDELAEAAGIDPVDLYGRSHMAEARKYADSRVRVGNRGYDLTLDLSKTYSLAVALAGEELAGELKETFLEVARETGAAMEGWAAYAMAGEHGNGHTADRVDTSGFLGWMTVHHSARPVGGVPGDPHLHVHISIPNMALAEDGKWRTVGAGGRDIHRHAHAADAYAKARLRQRTSERFGMRWERHPETGAWEVVGIDEGLRREFSRRSIQITAAAGDDATTLEQKLIARQLAEGKDTALTPTDVRAAWRERAEEVVDDVDAMIRPAVPGPGGPDGPAVSGPDGGPIVPSPEEIAAYIWRRDGGLTESRKTATRADVLAAVIDACPYGVPDLAAAEALTDAVLAVDAEAVALPTRGMGHLTNPQRYTNASVLEAEQVITEAATDRLAEGAAQITPAAAELAVSTFEASRTNDPDRPFRMSDEQRAATLRFLTAGHGLDVLRGKAGTGKTTIMAAVRMGWEAAGLRVAGAATAAVAASKLQAESGIPSATVATWLMDIRDGGRRMAGTDVLVLEEAAMVDDRDVAALLTAAGEHGVKIVAIGDWAQLRAIGVGGSFQRAHELVDGLELSENRRQKDTAERAALEAWLDGGRRTALSMLAEHGHVHAVRTPDDAYAAMLGAWKDAVASLEGDVHDQIEDLVVLAARNEDVETLNAGARELRKKAGELTRGHTYAMAGGERIELAAGDIVRIKRNDYRTRRGGDVDVLNGYRGQVAYASTGGVAVEWRRPAEDGGYSIERAWITADQIAAGTLQHGYAMTIAAAQGQTSDYALVYGVGAEANSLYPALSRARLATHLWLPADVIEDEETRIRLGEARSEQELLDRAVAAYADSLERDQGDRMVSDELAGVPDAPLIPHQAEPVRAVDDIEQHRDPEPVQEAPDGAVDHEAAQAVRIPAQGFPEGPESAVQGRGEAETEPTLAERAAARQARIDALREQYADQEVTDAQHERLQELLAAGYASRPQQQPEPDPEFTPWRDREWGRVATGRLDSRTSDETVEARRAERQAEDYDRRAAEREAKLAAEITPGRARAAEAAAVIERADALARTAQQEAARAQEAHQAAEAAREVRDQVAKSLNKSRIALRLAGTSRKETEDVVNQFSGKMAAAYEEWQDAKSAARDAEREAWQTIRDYPRKEMFRAQGATGALWPTSVEDMREQLAAMREHLPTIEQRIDDRHAAEAQRLRRQAAEARESAAGHRAAAAGLQQEKELRKRMETRAPHQYARESQQRTAAIQAARQRKAEQARQAAERAQRDHRRYEPPSQGRSGPSLGR